MGWAKDITSVTVCPETPTLSATIGLLLLAVIFGEAILGLGFIFTEIFTDTGRNRLFFCKFLPYLFFRCACHLYAGRKTQP